MTKEKRSHRVHRPSLGRIARVLPEAGSREARLLSHILKCELCSDAALSILEIGNRAPRGKGANYDSAFAAAAAKATSIFEQTRSALALAEGLFEISDPEERRRRARELARVDPWSVTESLLKAANHLLETDPDRAGELAKLAAVAVEDMNSEDHPSADKIRLFEEAHRLRGESLYRLQEQVEEALDQAERQFAETTGFVLYPYSTRSIRRRRARDKRKDCDG
jgi:hypothetical protein